MNPRLRNPLSLTTPNAPPQLYPGNSVLIHHPHTMKLTSLFESIIINSQQAKELFDRGLESEAFNRLNEITRTIDVLKDFKSKYASLQLPASMTPLIPPSVPSVRGQKRAAPIKPDKGKKAQKTGIDDTPTIASEAYGVHNGDLSGQLIANDNTVARNNHPHPLLDPTTVSRLDEIFFQFLNNLCSNLDAVDSKGEKIHQTLMAKKMQKLDESPDFRPFKFRIQAFVNAFHEELIRNGFTEDVFALRKIKIYLWKSRFISRFNEDGKKAKSKGNHVWNIEAKKIPSGGWVFREFTRKISGPPPKVAYIGLKYQWEPKVWDPQMRSPKVVFHSPWLPDWLHWENNVLTGTPGIDAENCEITAVANYYHGDTVYKLEKTFFIQVTHLDAADLPFTIMPPQ